MVFSLVPTAEVKHLPEQTLRSKRFIWTWGYSPSLTEAKAETLFLFIFVLSLFVLVWREFVDLVTHFKSQTRCFTESMYCCFNLYLINFSPNSLLGLLLVVFLKEHHQVIYLGSLIASGTGMYTPGGRKLCSHLPGFLATF